jgi:hypothetical protein
MGRRGDNTLIANGDNLDIGYRVGKGNGFGKSNGLTFIAFEEFRLNAGHSRASIKYGEEVFMIIAKRPKICQRDILSADFWEVARKSFSARDLEAVSDCTDCPPMPSAHATSFSK